MPDNCKDETWFRNEFNAQFQEKFGINKTFIYAFMDSWSQSPLGIHDPVQQEYWQRETQKLWDFSTERNETFEFMTIDDVLEENAACKEENERLLDIINEEIAKLQDDVRENKAAIESNTAEIIQDGEKITDTQSSIVLLTRDVEDQEKMIVANTESIATTNSKVGDQEEMILENTEYIAATNSRVGEAELRIGENQNAVEDNTAAIDILSMEGKFSTFKLKDILFIFSI